MTTRHVYRIFVKAPIERVWEALIEPDFTRRYFHRTAFETPPVAGRAYRTVMPDGAGAVDGTIEVCEPPHRLVMTWHTLYDAALAEEPPSRVEWELTAAGDGLTRVDLVHGDLFKSPKTWARVKDGWVWILNGLKTVLETGEELPTEHADGTAEPTDDGEAAWHRTAGITANNNAWTFIAKPAADRSPEDDEEMLRHAYAAAYHWQRAARRGPENEARASWMLSRCWVIVGNGALAMQYAERCMTVCAANGLADFDLAYAHEARARALACLGRADEARAERSDAASVQIGDEEDRAIVDADLASEPWFGVD